MPIIRGLVYDEALRIWPCQGCRHLVRCDSNGSCNYIFNMGHRRPCPPGEGCTAKELDVPANRIPAKPRRKYDVKRLKELYQSGMRWDDIAAEMGVDKRTLQNVVSHRKYANLRARKPVSRVTFDESEAWRLYKSGLSIKQVAERMGIAPGTLQKYSSDGRWCETRRIEREQEEDQRGERKRARKDRERSD